MLGAKVLLLNDDPAVAASLRAPLARRGLELLCAGEGSDGIRQFIACESDAVVVHDPAADTSGWETARRIREISDVPILFISDHADRASVERGLRIGDDYMPPPWNWERLAARLAALIKRTVHQTRRLLLYEDGDLKIDVASRRVTKRGDPVHLTDTEFNLLSYFARNADRVLNYDELQAHVWGYPYSQARSQLSLYVRRLRSKIEDTPSQPRYLRTEWGVGYSFGLRSS